MPDRIRKAVFPVGGLGIRFLPATKAMPKEMLTVVDKPLIQYAVEEARAAGIEEFIFVTGRGKTLIEDHFDHSYELNDMLSTRGKQAELEAINDWMLDAGQVGYTRQQEPLGLGHAVWCARNMVGDEPFAVLLADDLILSEEPCLKQMTDAWTATGGNMIAAMEVPPSQTNLYGILDPAGDEIQLTDALSAMIGSAPFHGFRFTGRRFDCGEKAGYIKANIAYALARDDLHDEIADFIGAARDQP